MDFQMILFDVSEKIATITFNRPDRLNALNIQLLGEISLAFDEIYDNPDINGVIITGSGEKAFAAGADIKEFAGFTISEGEKLSRNGHAVMNKIEQCPKPVIAAVNGYAFGGGCELAMACHLRLASLNAVFGQPEVNLGLIPGYGGTQRMIQLVGKGKALELIMTGDSVTAQDALTLGLVNAVIEEDLIQAAKKMMNRILSKGPIAISGVIQAANAYFDVDIDGFEKEIKLFCETFGTDDFKEGTSAFIEKRKPDFTGR